MRRKTGFLPVAVTFLLSVGASLLPISLKADTYQASIKDKPFAEVVGVNGYQSNDSVTGVQELNDEYLEIKTLWFEGIGKGIHSVFLVNQYADHLILGAEMEKAKAFILSTLYLPNISISEKNSRVKHYIENTAQFNKFKNSELDTFIVEVKKDLSAIKKTGLANLELKDPAAVKQDFKTIGRVVADKISLYVTNNKVATAADIDVMAKNISGLGPVKVAELKAKLAEINGVKADFEAMLADFDKNLPYQEQVKANRLKNLANLNTVTDGLGGMLDVLQLASATINIAGGDYTVSDLWDVPSAIAGLVGVFNACTKTKACSAGTGYVQVLSSTKQFVQSSSMLLSVLADDTHWSDVLERRDRAMLMPLQTKAFFQDMAAEIYNQWLIHGILAAKAVDELNFPMLIAQLNSMESVQQTALSLKEIDNRGFLENFSYAAFFGYSIDPALANGFEEIIDPSVTIEQLSQVYFYKYLVEVGKKQNRLLEQARLELLNEINALQSDLNSFTVFVSDKKSSAGNIEDNAVLFTPDELFYFCFEPHLYDYNGSTQTEVPLFSHALYLKHQDSGQMFRLSPSENVEPASCYPFNAPGAGLYRFTSVVASTELNGTLTEVIADDLSGKTLKLFDYVSLEQPGTGVVATQPLNDTGITFCGGAASGNNSPCNGSEPTGQDAHYGRDAAYAAGALTKVGGGHAGFDYTKIANNGSELPGSAELGAGPNDWACTRDNVTGLLWEVKLNDSTHLRHMGHTYTWYDSQSPDGNAGSLGNTSSCSNTLGGENCNTENYVTAVKATNLCGYSDWRMPLRHELLSIINYNRVNPSIDTSFFVNTPSSNVWSGSPYSFNSNDAWVVSFDYGYAYHSHRGLNPHVRLVRGGQ
ncbi:DUF1566 domain-containing protein [Rheinheimera baltica]|uniref:DUF1566 domain-containing protein n=1 Tax=Rheinheimera baltica TaxID=67576 RepID=A0ABT9I1V2_9GAMM|nr:DUF1566 domain-containing protein [Rheinheimera baltica]MDP5137338.1 DUF1566 domain-containing protein [Rheinheimera baltica]